MRHFVDFEMAAPHGCVFAAWLIAGKGSFTRVRPLVPREDGAFRGRVLAARLLARKKALTRARHLELRTFFATARAPVLRLTLPRSYICLNLVALGLALLLYPPAHFRVKRLCDKGSNFISSEDLIDCD